MGMVDGFLLFTIVDVWRMILPLGLTLILFMTELFGLWQKDGHFGTISEMLNPLVFRLTLGLLIFSGIIGFLVPSILGYSLPESHIAGGPWGYEEILAFLIGGLCLWRSRQQDRAGWHLRLLWIGCAAVMFVGAGVFWVGRWDAMTHAGHIPEGWFVPDVHRVNWMRVTPKVFHLLFAGLAAGGVVVTLLGLKGWRETGTESASDFMAASDPSIIRYGIGWILMGLVPQIFIGSWLFLILGEVPRGDLIAGTGFSSLIFFVSVTAALLALVLLNASFMVPQVRGLVWGGLGCVMVTLVLMGLIRYMVFLATLQSRRIPIAIGAVTPFDLLTILILLALLGAALGQWCVTPASFSSYPGQRLDKRFLAN